MTDSQINTIFLFFFFLTLDDKKSFELAVLARNEFAKSNHLDGSESQIFLTRALIRVWQKNEKRISKSKSSKNMNQSVVFNQGVDFGPWQELRKKISSDKILVILLVDILKVSPQAVATSMEVPMGTLRTRLEEARLKLGGFCRIDAGRPALRSV